MNSQKQFFFTVFFLVLLGAARAQDKLPVKFGKVTPQDFNVTAPGADSATDAIVIADYGISTFEGNNQGRFDIIFKHSCRIKILKRTGFDAATIEIPLYVLGTQMEKLSGLRASTYNLENGQVVETKLDDKSVFADRLSRNWMQKKFTFPALKEGSIIEYTFTQSSPFVFNLQPWEFQREYPTLWSEYQVDMPHFYRYVTIGHGYVPFNINSTEDRMATFHVTLPGGADKDERDDFQDDVVTHRWVMKNVPALKQEPYTTSTINYLSRLEFQLATIQYPNSFPKDIMGTWVGLSEDLLKDEDFGADLDRNNGWLDDDLRTITAGSKTQREKAQLIYAFVRDKFTCTSHSSLYVSDPLKTVFKNRHGNEAELNLLLTAMLHHEKIEADPVILSTRSHGFANEVYPLMSRFNYVISRVTIDSSWYYLDASESWLGFGRLPERCYNGYARVINKEMPTSVSLDADAMRESKVTLAIISKGEKGGLTGHLQTTPGFNEACVVREKLKSSSQDDYFKTVKAAYTGEYAVSGFELDSLKRPDDPLGIGYDIQINPDPGSDIFYFNPMLGEGYKENPFKSAERRYPVEMPFAMDQTYTMTMDIPDGYVVDELPKQTKVLFNDDEGLFEYLLVKSGDNIQFRSRIKLNKANFKPEDYASLRDFFGFIVKKQSEQIVFKKKKA